MWFQFSGDAESLDALHLTGISQDVPELSFARQRTESRLNVAVALRRLLLELMDCGYPKPTVLTQVDVCG